MRIIIANPRGYCAGVERAVESVRRALELFSPPIYVRHEIVHNGVVVQRLRELGAVFVEELAAVPAGSIVFFSAHGVGPEVRQEAEARGLLVIDATCPLVAKVHLEVAAHARAGRTVFLIGHRGHAEVIGTFGHYRGRGRILIVEDERDAASVDVDPAAELAYVTQTTLSVEETARTVAVLKARFPHLIEPRSDDICYATENRQNAVRELAPLCDAIVVLGARHSSNSTRLREVAEATGVKAYLVEHSGQLTRSSFDGCKVIGVTSGASVPEDLVGELIRVFTSWWPGVRLENRGQPETVHFRLPREIDVLASSRGTLVREEATRW